MLSAHESPYYIAQGGIDWVGNEQWKPITTGGGGNFQFATLEVESLSAYV